MYEHVMTLHNSCWVLTFFCIFDRFKESGANLWLSGEDIDLIIYILQ